MRHMTCEQYYFLNDDVIDDFMQDLFWRDGYGSTVEPFEAMCKWAADEGVLLTDLDSWDFSEFFAACWQCGEWGLS